MRNLKRFQNKKRLNPTSGLPDTRSHGRRWRREEEVERGEGGRRRIRRGRMFLVFSYKSLVYVECRQSFQNKTLLTGGFPSRNQTTKVKTYMYRYSNGGPTCAR